MEEFVLKRVKEIKRCNADLNPLKYFVHINESYPRAHAHTRIEREEGERDAHT